MPRRRMLVLLWVVMVGMLAACRSAATPSVQIAPAAGATPPAAQLNQPATVVATVSTQQRPPATVASRPVPRPPATPAPVRPPPTADAEDVALERVIERALGGDADGSGVAVRRLTDGAWARWNADQVYYAASLYKLEVLYEAFRQRALGLLDFDRSVAIEEQYAAEDLGTLALVPRAPDGSVFIGDAVRAMITLSDNASATLLLDLLGHRTIDATMATLGLRSSSVNTTELPTSAADMARLMEVVARGEGLDAPAAQEMLSYLLAQETRAGIPRGVPAGVPVGNKTGTWEGATHDVAIVLAPAGAYVIAVLTDRGWDWDPIARVSAAVYDYWNAPTRAAGGP